MPWCFVFSSCPRARAVPGGEVFWAYCAANVSVARRQQQPHRVSSIGAVQDIDTDSSYELTAHSELCRCLGADGGLDGVAAHGGMCKRWSGDVLPWCYVSEACPTARALQRRANNSTEKFWSHCLPGVNDKPPPATDAPTPAPSPQRTQAPTPTTTAAPTPATIAPTPDIAVACRCSGDADKLGRGDRCAEQLTASRDGPPADPLPWCYVRRDCPYARPSRYFAPGGTEGEMRLFWRHCEKDPDRQSVIPKRHLTYWQHQAYGLSVALGNGHA